VTSPGSPDPGALEGVLGHRFRRPELLREALTHASAEEAHNERLEFLGDAVLSLVAAEELYVRFPKAREGRLTDSKSRLVARATLARVARRLGLEPWLVTGGSLEIRRSVPRSVLGNAVEALLGAIYLDAGLEAAREAFRRWLAPEIRALEESPSRIHAKQRLQELCQKRFGGLPRYRILEQVEHPETTAFQAAVEIGERSFPPAWGTTKKEAERWAAWEALLVLEAETPEEGEDAPDPAEV